MQEDRTDVIHISRQALSLERLTYATIVLMSVLVVYDGWGQLASFAGAAVVILGPTLALAAAEWVARSRAGKGAHEAPARTRKAPTPASYPVAPTAGPAWPPGPWRTSH